MRTYNMFNNAVSSPEYAASNERIILKILQLTYARSFLRTQIPLAILGFRNLQNTKQQR
jgi:hypothetical protein